MNEEKLRQLEAENAKLKAELADQQLKCKKASEALVPKLVAVLGYIRAVLQKQTSFDAKLIGEILTMAEKDGTEALRLASALRTGSNE